MRLFLGVDGGQSSTTAFVGDETGRVVGVGRGGPCNHISGPEASGKFVEAIGGAVRQALDGRAIRFEAACFGFSGGPSDKEHLTRQIVAADAYSFTHDGLIALVGATAGAPGVVTIAGTGSFAFGRNAEHRAARAGGWGFIFGDHGSGFDLVREALRAALRFEEGWGPPTSLRPMLLDATGTENANDLLHQFYTPEFPRARIASFARVVHQAARAGDLVAREILNGAAQSLATIASAVRGQLFSPGQIACISFIGGMFRSDLLLARFQMLMELHEENRVAAPLHGPAAGALLEAYRIAGLKCEISAEPEAASENDRLR
jgi:N-acetylglucosamine kinase-like BadF-type ATPase